MKTSPYTQCQSDKMAHFALYTQCKSDKMAHFALYTQCQSDKMAHFALCTPCQSDKMAHFAVKSRRDDILLTVGFNLRKNVARHVSTSPAGTAFYRVLRTEYK